VAGLCSEFANRDHQVAVACRPGAALLSRLDPRIPVCTLPLRGALDLVSLFRLNRFIRTQNLDWINAHNGRDYPVAFITSRITGGYCAFWRRYYRLNRSTVTRALIRRADLVITQNQAQRAAMRDTIGVDERRLVYIPEWIKPPDPATPMGPGAAQLAACDKPYRVAVFGSIHPHKGQKEFVDAATRVLGERSDVCFYIVGVNDSTRQSAYFRELRRTIESTGRQADIRFIDWLPDINEILPRMTLTVFPSHGEAFGRVAAESMAAGVGVIATNVTGLREIVRDGHNGLLVPLGDNLALARAISRLLSDAALRERIVATARDDARREFGCDSVTTRIEQAYRRIADQRHSLTTT